MARKRFYITKHCVKCHHRLTEEEIHFEDICPYCGHMPKFVLLECYKKRHDRFAEEGKAVRYVDIVEEPREPRWWTKLWRHGDASTSL